MGCALVAQCRAEPSPYFCDLSPSSPSSLPSSPISTFSSTPRGGGGSQSACTFDGYASGSCQPQRYAREEGCTIVTPFANTQCRDVGVSETTLGFDSKRWGQHYGRFGRCLPIAPEPATWQIREAFSVSR